MTGMNNATREVFGNIAPWMRVVFFIMIAASIAVLAWQVAARVWLWRKGQRGGFERDWRVWSSASCRVCAGAKTCSSKVARRSSPPAAIQWLCRADDRHDAVGDRLRWAVLFSPRLVLPRSMN